jgi:tetratricopeptide (TPR) repeat protein
MGGLHYKKARFELAMGFYLKSIQIKETQGHVHFNLGLVYKKQGSFVKAREHFERALALGFVRARYSLNKLPMTKKQKKNGWKFWKKE